jgi:hypothetical protein
VAGGVGAEVMDVAVAGAVCCGGRARGEAAGAGEQYELQGQQLELEQEDSGAYKIYVRRLELFPHQKHAGNAAGHLA